MWSAVCLMAPHSQFEKEARPHLCVDEQKHPTPERGRLSLTQDVLGEPTPESLKAWTADVLKAVELWCKKKTKSFFFGQSP